MIIRTVFLIGFSALASFATSAAVQAQDVTPPNTSVRNLEAPVDVRRKQLHGHHTMMRHHAMMTSRHHFAHRALAGSATLERH